MEKRLTKTREGKKWLGVCAGFGKYLECDPTIIRLIVATLALCGGGGLIFYLLAAIIMPFDE